jgi:hypothetical protein
MSKKNVVNQQTAIEAAERLLAEKRQKDIEACVKEINAAEIKHIQPILEKYKCARNFSLSLNGDRIIVNMVVDKA